MTIGFARGNMIADMNVLKGIVAVASLTSRLSHADVDW